MVLSHADFYQNNGLLLTRWHQLGFVARVWYGAFAGPSGLNPAIVGVFWGLFQGYRCAFVPERFGLWRLFLVFQCVCWNGASTNL